jgi:hypothetical protein
MEIALLGPPITATDPALGDATLTPVFEQTSALSQG